MSCLSVERSTAIVSFAWRNGDSGAIIERTADGGGVWAVQLRDFIAECAAAGEPLRRILVGTGPGSFAGVRAALAFAQGYAAMRPEIEVAGLFSPCASAAAAGCGGTPLAVVGDARRGACWLAKFEGRRLVAPLSVMPADALAGAVPDGARVCSPDDSRIGARLRDTFGERYLGEVLPTAGALLAAAEDNGGWMTREPLPAYLNPAVR